MIPGHLLFEKSCCTYFVNSPVLTNRRRSHCPANCEEEQGDGGSREFSRVSGDISGRGGVVGTYLWRSSSP
jgi:hypothetical protein